MAPHADHAKLASQARRLYIEQLLKGLPAVVTAVTAGVRNLLDKPAEYATAQRRRDLVQNLMKQSGQWHGAMASGMRHVLQHGVTASMPGDAPARNDVFSLVDNDTIEREILTSRLALAVMDRVSWEFTDLRSRIAMLERRGELDTHDMLRAHVLARVVLEAWRSAGLNHEAWRDLQITLHEEFGHLVEEAYHEVNRYLMEQRVLPEVDLRPFIRRTANGVSPGGPASGSGASSGYRATGVDTGVGATGPAPTSGPTGMAPLSRPQGVGEETRLMTRATPLARGGNHAEAVLGRLNSLVARHLPQFSDTARQQPASPALVQAIEQAGASSTQSPGRASSRARAMTWANVPRATSTGTSWPRSR